tara:strand:+ start:389 stop:592 length:204 start_codon:yes stop_codon:yes gene_type:complete
MKISADKVIDDEEVLHEYHLIDDTTNAIDGEVAAEVTSRDIEDADAHYLSLEKDKSINSTTIKKKGL